MKLKEKQFDNILDIQEASTEVFSTILKKKLSAEFSKTIESL